SQGKASMFACRNLRLCWMNLSVCCDGFHEWAVGNLTTTVHCGATEGRKHENHKLQTYTKE
ncbi:MAG: hypothetical protein RR234_07045, partial [Christensenella sp.]